MNKQPSRSQRSRRNARRGKYPAVSAADSADRRQRFERGPTPGSWFKSALTPLNLTVYGILLILGIAGILLSINDRSGDQLWGFFPLFVSATLYSAWMMLSVLFEPTSTADTFTRLGYSTLIAPWVMSVPISIAYAIIFFAADLARFRDRHYFHGEGLGNTILSPIISWFAGGVAALAVLLLIVLPVQYARERKALTGARAQFATFTSAVASPAPSTDAPPTPRTVAPLMAIERLPVILPSGALTWRQELRSVFGWPNAVAFLVLFGVTAVATYFNVGEPWSGWGIVSYPLPAMLFSMWLVLDAICRRPDRIKIGKRVTIAALLAPLVFTLLQLAVAAIAVPLNSNAIGGMPLRRYLPVGIEPGIFVFMGVLFAAALALVTWLVAGSVTALLRAWARRHPIAVSQPRLIRYSTALIGAGLTPFALGWLASYGLERGFGITWRMLQSAIGSGAPDLAPFLVIWITIMVLRYGGGALVVGGVLLGVVAIRRRYVTATAPVVPLPLPATEEAAPPQIPPSFVEPAPGEEPHPDSPLAEYLASVQYDGPAVSEAPEPRPKGRRLQLPGRRARTRDLDTLGQ